MKNIGRFLGIIAILVIIGLAVSCEQEAEPDDQIVITVTGLPSEANGKYAVMGIAESSGKSASLKAISSAAKPISGNQAKTPMNFADGGKNNGKAFGEKGNYFIILLIYNEYPTEDSPTLYVGYTDVKVTLDKGDVNEVPASKFTPVPQADDFQTTPVQPPDGKPAADDYGTYKATYGSTPITETVVLTQKTTESGYDQFVISDNSQPSGSAQDQLTFRIEKWEAATLPTGYSDYTGAYKFTGRILSATGTVGTRQGYVPSTYTAPTSAGFSDAAFSTDVKADGTGTECWMYIYFKGTTGGITFVRTAFSKTGGTETKTVVADSSGNPRVYTKQP